MYDHTGYTWVCSFFVLTDLSLNFQTFFSEILPSYSNSSSLVRDSASSSYPEEGVSPFWNPGRWTSPWYPKKRRRWSQETGRRKTSVLGWPAPGKLQALVGQDKVCIKYLNQSTPYKWGLKFSNISDMRLDQKNDPLLLHSRMELTVASHEVAPTWGFGFGS